MSRRESRSSLGARQSNALEEFENFKKKYLLVNKHIAKLNSSLNVRIEELLSQIAALNIENLRLKTSELNLARKLEDEKFKVRKLYNETESASQMFIARMTSIRASFGLDKPQGPSQFEELSVASGGCVIKSLPCPIPRLSRPPDVESITEAAEEAPTPMKASPRSPTSPAASTPVSRRRSTGSTPTPSLATTSGRQAAPISVAENSKAGGSDRRHSPPLVMDAISGSSPLTPGPFSINQSEVASSSPTYPNGRRSPLVSPSPCSTPPTSEDEYGAGGKEKNPVVSGAEIPTLPHFNLNGMKRVIRRPSGLIKSEVTGLPSSSLPPPVVPSEPRTPPKASLGIPGSASPITPTRTIPMSPVLTANPALSPPPTKKLSLARRQLDFGIHDSDEEEDEDEAMEMNDSHPIEEGLLSFQSDSIVGKRAPKRKNPENDEDIVSSVTVRAGATRRRQEKRRDTGTVIPGSALMEKTSIDGLLKERNSKDSLRDVTNGRMHSSETSEEQREGPIATGPSLVAAAGTTVGPNSRSNGSSTHGIDIAGIAAKLERLSSKPKPPVPLATLPLPSSNKDIKIPLDLDEGNHADPNDPNSAVADLGRRNSGRQRKSVNYKEPSLVTKMRKPDSLPPPGSAPSSQSTLSSIHSASTVLQRAPKRKQGSISLVDEIVQTAAASSTTEVEGEAEPKPLSKDEGTSIKPPGIQRSRRKAVWDRYPDLSDEEQVDKEDGVEGDANTPPSNGGYMTSNSSLSRPSFSGYRGSSVLTRGVNPIISGGAANSSSIVDIVGRNFAALKVAPGAARERVREELTDPAVSITEFGSPPNGLKEIIDSYEVAGDRYGEEMTGEGGECGEKVRRGVCFEPDEVDVPAPNAKVALVEREEEYGVLLPPIAEFL
ncbi:hypothetical protein FRC17_004604 [Serendipita sp. 399]|nr:hypothetical protein FRC17_004604 [Serendipita sp. 399]